MFFWADLSKAALIDGSFTTVTDATFNSTNVSAYVPRAKLGGGYVSAYSGNQYDWQCYMPRTDLCGRNFFAINASSAIHDYGTFDTASPGMIVADAAAFDSKIDDGLPTTGIVFAMFPGAQAGCCIGWSPNAATASSATCFDTTTNQYSTAQGGRGLNCGVSIQMQ